MKSLSVVFPVRVSEDRTDILDRLYYFKLDTRKPDEVEVVVIDDGSPLQFSAIIEQHCRDLGISYYRIDSENRQFSVGRARNYAAQVLTTKFIMFQDIDLLPYPGFYQDVLIECRVQQLDVYADRFIMIGVIYLTEAASKEFFETDADLRKSKYISALLENDISSVEKFSTGTSVTVWRRDHYLCTGGNDPDFEGWGYEDLEYACRAIRRNRKFPLPADFKLDLKNFTTIQEYRGWKSIYRLYGDITFKKGIVMFHRWHPVHHAGAYISGKKRNKSLFEEKLLNFARDGVEPDPLPNLKNGKSLLFKTNPWVLNRWTAPNLGEIVVVGEDYFDVSSFLKFVDANKISRVVFHNPYANEAMLAIYRAVRERNIEYLVCERGALRDSVFIDSRGFNSDSRSYDPVYWDHPLTPEFRKNTIDYIINEKNSSESLEDQPDYLTPSQIRKKLKINKGRKILFVPLQRPSDTVIQYFSGSIGNFDNFINLIKGLTHLLPPDWDIVIKRHPLEVDTPEISGVYYSNDENVKSLINMSDAILLINSGVGVLGLLYQKPVFVAGDAFYDHDGLTKKISSAEELVESLGVFKPDTSKVLRFLSYLINEFYSFGKFATRTVPWVGGAKMTATTAIDFYCVRFPGADEMALERSNSPTIPSTSVLFDRYRNIDGTLRNEAARPALAIKTATLPPKNKEASISVAKVSSPVSKDNEISTLASVTSIVAVKPKKSRVGAKYKKFRADPARFLRDSKIPFLQLVGKVVK